MRKNENKSMFSTWMVLFMSIAMLFSACEKLDEDLTTKSDSKRTTKKVYVQNKEREVTGPTTEECRWEKVTELDGQKTVKKFSYTLQRSLKGIEEYRKEVSGFGYKHSKNNAIERGEASQVRTEDGGIAKISGRTDKLSGVKENGFETDVITMPYDFYHEMLSFDDGEIQVEFPFEEVQFSEKETKVASITSPVTGKEAARLSNTIATKYIGYNQDASESVILLMEKGVTIISEDFVESSCKETPTNSSVKAYFLYRINKSDGSHEDYSVEVSDDRTATVKGPWSSTESSNSQTTGSVNKTETGSANKSTSKDGFEISWKRYSYDCKAIVTLAGSTQENLLQTVEPEGWTAKFRGKTYTIPRPSYTVSNDKGSVTGGAESNGYKVYDYANKYTYTRSNNTQNFTPKGVIKVKVEVPEDTFFPKEWGTLLSAKQTVANNETHNGFVYTWLLSFKNNVKLPVVVRSGDATPEWHFEYAETTTVEDYNGGTYDKSTKTWICTTASDKPNQMVWSRNSKEKANKDYQIARNQNWDEGRMVDGHPSTKTTRYQLKVTDGKLTATDTYTGKYMGAWK